MAGRLVEIEKELTCVQFYVHGISWNQGSNAQVQQVLSRFCFVFEKKKSIH